MSARYRLLGHNPATGHRTVDRFNLFDGMFSEIENLTARGYTVHAYESIDGQWAEI